MKEAIHEIETLSETIRSSKEGKKVHATAYLELGEEFLTLNNDINEALNCWKKGLEYAVDSSMKTQLDGAISDACTEQVKRLVKGKKFDEAIALLERGERLVTDEQYWKSFRELLAIIYCDRGIIYLNGYYLSKAESDFKRALKYNRNNMRAKEGLSQVYGIQNVPLYGRLF